MTTLEMILTILAALGMFGFYALMELVPGSVRELRTADSAFRMPDMRFHYGSNLLYAQLDAVGEEGRAKMRRYWLFDFGFILCFWGVMAAITLNVSSRGSVLFTGMLIAATVRGAMDLLENILLLRVDAAYPTPKNMLANVAGYVTSVKFIAMGLWVAALFARLVLRAFAQYA